MTNPRKRSPKTPLAIHPDVRSALDAGKAVVALESTVFSTLGLPHPHNANALENAHAAVRAAGAVPAMTAVVDGQAMIGVDPAHWERILVADRKVAERDLAVALGQRWPTGVTTVSATVRLASLAGVRVFATGGIGGVHRGASHDVSADLGALARHPVITVSAGAKSFLDLANTLEHLETLSVPVLGWKTDRFPAFTATDSGLAVPHRVNGAAEVAQIAAARFALEQGGMLVAVPPPAPIDDSVLAAATAEAEKAAAAANASGPALTPFILEHIAEASGGSSVAANIALVENNAEVAAEIAIAVAGQG